MHSFGFTIINKELDGVYGDENIIITFRNGKFR